MVNLNSIELDNILVFKSLEYIDFIQDSLHCARVLLFDRDLTTPWLQHIGYGGGAYLFDSIDFTRRQVPALVYFAKSSLPCVHRELIQGCGLMGVVYLASCLAATCS